MVKSNSFNKKEVEKKKDQKRKEKLKRKEERKANGGGRSFEEMIAYVDENGVICDTPPDLANKQEVDVENIVISTPKKEEVKEVILQGRVTYFNPGKGYGFIEDLSRMEKYFFHISNAPEDIIEGNRVTFELERGDKGMNATRIVLTKELKNNI
jgi:cold shock CspA family protein